mgnify:FL=1
MRKILVVDDERRIADMMQKFLSRMGFEVVEAYGGEEALGILRSGVRFDMMIVDIRMPGVNGFEVIKATFAMSIKMPIIVLTGTVDAETCIAELGGLGFSASDIVRKPADLFELLELVKSKLGAEEENGSA